MRLNATPALFIFFSRPDVLNSYLKSVLEQSELLHMCLACWMSQARCFWHTHKKKLIFSDNGGFDWAATANLSLFFFYTRPWGKYWKTLVNLPAITSRCNFTTDLLVLRLLSPSKLAAIYFGSGGFFFFLFFFFTITISNAFMYFFLVCATLVLASSSGPRVGEEHLPLAPPGHQCPQRCQSHSSCH